MAAFGKSIRIHLKDGNVSGIKTAELVNHTILSFSCPRLRASEMQAFAETKRPGVYFLLGPDEETNEPKVYIGESENVFDRLQSHIANKDFWNEFIFFVSKDENLTKAHVKYLESRLIQMAFQTKRYKVDNSNQSQLSSLPPSDKDSMEEFLSHIKLLLGVLGHKFLEEITKISKESIPVCSDDLAYKEDLDINTNRELHLSVSGLRASAIQTDEGIVVLKGSDAALECRNYLSDGYKDLRDRLIKNGDLLLSVDKYIFQNDILFNAASPAAAIVVGYNINGTQNWKSIEGKSLKEIERERVMGKLRSSDK